MKIFESYLCTMPQTLIPTHLFEDADELGIPFRLVELTFPTGYAVSDAHRHNYFEIFYFSQGNGEHLVDFKEYPLSAPSLHFVAPGQVHRIKRSADSLGKVLLFTNDFINFHPEINNIIYRLPFLKPEANPAFPLQGEIRNQVVDLIMNIESEYKRKTDASFEIIRSYLYILLLRCRDHHELAESGEFSGEEPMLAKFRQLVEEHFREWHLPNQYADEMQISAKHLNELIKKTMGIPPGEIIRERLLLEAKRMLYNSEMSSKEISYHLNFNDPAYFSRFFKQNTGQSVIEFRETSRKKYM